MQKEGTRPRISNKRCYWALGFITCSVIFILGVFIFLLEDLMQTPPIIDGTGQFVEAVRESITFNDEKIIKKGDLKYSDVEVKRFVVGDRSIKRTIIATEVAGTSKSPREFLTMLYASWAHVRSLWTTDSKVVVDIWVACEPKACPYMPIDCIKFRGEKTLDYIRYNIQPKCIYYELPVDYERKWKKLRYMFMTSLEFAAQQPFTDIVQYYDYVLRADIDCFITPTILEWIPQYSSAFGYGFLGSGFTSQRLRYVAEKMNLTHRGVHHFQSTWYVAAKDFVPLIKLTVDLAIHLLENEFTYAACQTIRKKFKKKCEWPDWHKGVTSLYASELAINHVIEDLTGDWKSKMLDVAVSEKNRKVKDVVCSHNIHVQLGDGDWHKFPFHAHFNKNWEEVCKLADTQYHWEGDAPGQDALINDYCRFVSWRSVHQACGHRNIKGYPTTSKWENPEEAEKEEKEKKEEEEKKRNEEEEKKQKAKEEKVSSKPVQPGRLPNGKMLSEVKHLKDKETPIQPNVVKKKEVE